MTKISGRKDAFPNMALPLASDVMDLYFCRPSCPQQTRFSATFASSLVIMFLRNCDEHAKVFGAENLLQRHQNLMSEILLSNKMMSEI